MNNSWTQQFTCVTTSKTKVKKLISKIIKLSNHSSEITANNSGRAESETRGAFLFASHKQPYRKRGRKSSPCHIYKMRPLRFWVTHFEWSNVFIMYLEYYNQHLDTGYWSCQHILGILVRKFLCVSLHSVYCSDYRESLHEVLLRMWSYSLIMIAYIWLRWSIKTEWYHWKSK